MKKYILILIFLVSQIAVQRLSAQPHRDEMDELRISYINQQLQLSPKEAEKFWPVYKEYHAKAMALKKNIHKSFKKYSVNMSDKDAEELYYLDLQTKQAEVELYKTYTEKVQAIIGTTKCVKLKIAELEFKREVIKSIKERQQ